MPFEQVWKILNEPFSILLLGSGVGFLFVKLVWEPFKLREAETRRRQSIRDEVAIRLFAMDQNIASAYPNVRGGLAASIDPAYQQWSLAGLIFVGWDQDAHKRCLSQLDQLVLSETDRADSQKLRTAQNALGTIRQVLGLRAV